MNYWYRILLICISALGVSHAVQAQHSVARKWNEVLLKSIRKDFARPTVHARNLFHVSVAMYDSWAAYDDTATPFLLGQYVNGFNCPFTGISYSNIKQAREETLSYAVYRLLHHRFKDSPGAGVSLALYDSLMDALGYDRYFTSIDYSNGSAAALGNYIAKNLIDFGMQDDANEFNFYANSHYNPVNPPLVPTIPGNPNIVDPNRWQPLSLNAFVDQAGNPIPGSSPPFLSPEWGQVTPFALRKHSLSIHRKDDYNYWTYFDPGPPPFLEGEFSDIYKWGFSMVSIWSSHLDPSDGEMWDISPGAMGNINDFPKTWDEYPNFYNTLEGGDYGSGRLINPRTGQPYEPQLVPRGDYTRVLAEFWADGPDSETPPGHWFTILNYVNDHPLFEKRFAGEGSILDDLEWDVKAYLTLGGAMHDCAISIWGIKGYYDYIRPISAIRCMADEGQSSDASLNNYSEMGITLIPEFIEVVKAGDPLAGSNNEHVGKIKLYTWRGHEYIADPLTDIAGVGWILAENWWPYQRPSFVTPPFAGYLSGHSGFSRAAAEVMTFLTGDEYFPGGIGEFHAPKNNFLEFEAGPSVDVTLQWATYRDASDQTSLSRIWGGIHSPVDDIKGRLIGNKIAEQAFSTASEYFNGSVIITGTGDHNYAKTPVKVFPNPVVAGNEITIVIGQQAPRCKLRLYNSLGQLVMTKNYDEIPASGTVNLLTERLSEGLYILNAEFDNLPTTSHKIRIQNE